MECKYGTCKYFLNGKCTKEKDISKLPIEEIVKALVENKCTLREEK